MSSGVILCRQGRICDAWRAHRIRAMILAFEASSWTLLSTRFTGIWERSLHKCLDLTRGQHFKIQLGQELALLDQEM
jgi:hypothetical protein